MGRTEYYAFVVRSVCCTDPECDIPYGTCHCQPRWLPRCWKTASIATRHDRRRGYIKGMHERFAHGHDRLSEEGRAIQSANMAAKMNELYADARRKAEWQRARHSYPGLPPNPRGFGYLGGLPTAELTDEQRGRIKLASRRWGRRKIASVFGLSERTVRNVLDELDP